MPLLAVHIPLPLPRLVCHTGMLDCQEGQLYAVQSK